jgi:SAM-dependent methyltransferase
MSWEGILMGFCRYCQSVLKYTFVDLGMSPLANSYLRPEQLNQMEEFYPLHAKVCNCCFLVQLEEFASPEHIFNDYAYLSSFSDTWLQHAKSYVDMIIERLSLYKNSQVVEIASNDGYLLQYFLTRDISVIGIEPAANVAIHAINKGIPTLVQFFGEKIARQMVHEEIKADLLIGNNVLAHVPKLNDFIRGMKILLHPKGVITLEFPHLMRLMDENQFDTIYHEHFSYFSFITVNNIFSHHGLTIFDVEELPTHGGSLRIYACHSEDTTKVISQNVIDLLSREEFSEYRNLENYLSFSKKLQKLKYDILTFLINAKKSKKSIVGYGAPAKGNTLLNYCGIRSDFIDYTVDRNPQKQGCFLPGSHIPILHPDYIKVTRPDYLLILPWNITNEIMKQVAYIREWGGEFIVLIPEVRIHP